MAERWRCRSTRRARCWKGAARWLVAPESPLAARVAVNRTWQAIFGRGLAEVPDDFGTRSPLPVQRDLLDWLAVDFVESGWSQKALVRRIVTSDTYKQSSRADAAALAEYAGNYRSDEAEVTHTLRVEKGQLVAYAGYRRLGVLEPSYRDGFTRGGSVIDMVRDAKGRLTGFLVEAGRVRGLRFTRVR